MSKFLEQRELRAKGRSFCDSYVYLFLLEFGCNPAITLCYSFPNEQMANGGKKRQSYEVIIQICLAVGDCAMAFLFIPQYVLFHSSTYWQDHQKKLESF